MNILITGTDGFIGSNLKKHFIGKDHHLTGTVFLHAPDSDEIKLDISRPQDFGKITGKKFDVIIHCAGVVDQDLPKKQIFTINTGGTRNLLEWASQAGCNHFIQISSVTAYGLSVMGENRTEDNTPRYEGIFALPYMRSKALAEKYIEGSGIKYTILRLPAVFGENDSYLSQAVIPALRNGDFFFCGNKDRLFSTMCIRNLGPIVDKIIQLGPQNDCYNCTDNQTTWHEFIGEFAKELKIDLKPGKKSVLSIVTHFNDKKFLLALVNSRFGAHYPNDKLTKLIGIIPKFPWQDGVRDAVRSFGKISP